MKPLRKSVISILLMCMPCGAFAEEPSVAPDAATAQLQMREADRAVRAGRLVQADAILIWLEQQAFPGLEAETRLLRSEYHMARRDADAANIELAKIPDLTTCRAQAVVSWTASQKQIWNKAIVAAAKATEACGEDPQHWNLLGLALAGKGELEASREAFDQALKRSPETPALLSNRAMILARLGRFEGAAADLDRAAMLKPDDVTIQKNRDFFRAALGAEPERQGTESDAQWAGRLANAADGAFANARREQAAALYSQSALLLDRFDARIWMRAQSEEE